MLYLSTLHLNPLCRDTWLDMADCQRMHCRVMSGFPQGPGNRAAHGALYRIDWPHGMGPARITVQSRTRPDWQALYQSGYLQGPATVEAVTHDYHQGEVLSFRLRAFPARAVDTKTRPDGTKSNGRRVPLHTDAERLDWLARKGEQSGFEIIQAQIDGTMDVGGLHRCGPLTFLAVEFSGLLHVCDPGLFAAALGAGIGRGKAYGFGLLLAGHAAKMTA